MLTDLEIRAAKPDPACELRLSDGEGLHIAITPDGKKFWRWDYTYNGRRKQLSFGPYKRLTLKEARGRKAAAQQQLADGIDPSVARRREKVAASTDTFRAVALEWLEKEAHTLGKGTVAKKRGQLDRYLLPALGGLTIAKIAVPDVLPLLKAIERRGNYETAHRVCQLASAIFRYAVTTSRATTDPAALLTDALKPVVTENHATLLQPVDVGTLLRALDRADATPFIVGALHLTPLVFLRPGELRKGEWAEVDFDRAMWTIPARRMKPLKDRKRMDHLVPLSTQALAILRDLKTIAGDNPLMFPGHKDPTAPISDATLAKVLRRLGYTSAQQTPHGFRTLASTHLREIGWENDLVELQLSHLIANKVRAVYDKAARVPERVRMMQAWADHLDAVKAGRVVAFTGRVLEMAARAS